MENYDYDQYNRIFSIARKQTEHALYLAKDLVARFPDFGRSWSSLYYILTVKNEYYEAVSAIEQAVKIEPNEPAWLIKAAESHLRIENFFEAIELLSKCIISSNNIKSIYYIESCYFTRSLCYCKIGDFYAARQDLEYVSDGQTAWIDRLRSKAELEEACRKKHLD